MLVCAFGACDGDPEPNEQKCICKPTMTIEMPQNEHRPPTCNNATFDWMMQTLLTEVSAQKEHIIKQNERIEDLQKKLQKHGEELNDHEEAKDKLTDAKKFVLREKHDLEIENKELQDTLDTQQRHHSDEVSELKAQNSQQASEIEELKEKMMKLQSPQKRSAEYGTLPKDCQDIQKKGSRYSGIYTVYPGQSDEGLQVFCDLNTDNGGWMLIQRRQDGSQRFDKTWNEYKDGFGQVAREFWIGNDNLHKITTAGEYELRIELLAFDGEFTSATYDFFSVDSEEENYTLTIGEYSGDSGDAMVSHNRHPFSTYDKDNDKSRSGNCSKLYGFGGWWFSHCYDANLNGEYFQDGPTSKQGINWFQWKKFESLRHVEMKIRPVDA